jgi:Raf kinase inhibitor-like YbhB/YbcL family protein
VRNGLAVGVFALVFVACAKSETPASSDTGAAALDTTTRAQQLPQSSTPMALKLTSSAFTANGSIPSRYTCEGDDISPPLAWSDAPKGTRSFALIVDDPDAPDPAHPKMTYVHWVVYGIPANVTSFEENAAKSGLPAGVQQGSNDWKKSTYGGPCPPIGRHRYFFKLYALDTELSGLNNPKKPDLEKAMQGHVIGNAQLVGTYQKEKK